MKEETKAEVMSCGWKISLFWKQWHIGCKETDWNYSHQTFIKYLLHAQFYVEYQDWGIFKHELGKLVSPGVHNQT